MASNKKDLGMTTNHYDTIIIGAGHNGLVAAAYLAKQGKKVLVLERRVILGGSVVTEYFGGGLTGGSVWTGRTLRPDIIKDLKLSIRDVTERPPFISALDVGRTGSPTYEDHLVIDADPMKAAESVKRFSE